MRTVFKKSFGVIVMITLMLISGFNEVPKPIQFGVIIGSDEIWSKGKPENLEWVDVNTSPQTWRREGDELVCTGNPIGVMRSVKQYENFMLHVEWKHMEAGGNSGIFLWSNAVPDAESRLPDGVEVQMLELEWPNLHKRDGVTPPLAYVHGELFGVGGGVGIDGGGGEGAHDFEGVGVAGT